MAGSRSSTQAAKIYQRTTASHTPIPISTILIPPINMSITNQHLAVPVSDYTENEPCSLDYQTPSRYYRDVSVVHSPSVKSKKNHARKDSRLRSKNILTGIIKSIKKAFGIKPKPSFLMPYETKNPTRSPSQSSMRSVATNATRMSNPNRNSAPAILLTGPTVRGRNSALRVHAYDGEDSPVPYIENKGKSLRFSHPTVRGVRPQTPMSMMAADFSERPDTSGGRSRSSTIETDCTTRSSPSADAPPPFRPNNVWRQSNQFNNEDGQQATFKEFKARLDGYMLVGADRESFPAWEPKEGNPPSLQFIARTSSIKMDERFADAAAPVADEAEIEKHRSETYSMLDAPPPQPPQYQQKKAKKMVFAIMPESDLPDSAVRVPSGQYLAALLPTQYPNGLIASTPQPESRLAMPRPHTFAAPSNYKPYRPQSYVAYSPRVARSSNAGSDTAQTQPTAPSKKVQGKMAADPKVPKALNLAESKTQDLVATDDDNKQQYDRVESSIFDNKQEPPPRPANPEPPARFSIEDDGEIGRTFPESPTPPASPPAAPTRIAPPAPARTIHRKPVSTPNLRESKPLPPLPPTDSPSKSKISIPQRMNSNRYPFFKNPAAAYSSEAMYKRRSIDPVEAKFRKEEAAEQAKKSKADEKIAKKEAKIAKQQKKASDKELKQKQKQIDEGVKKLLGL